MGVFIVCGGGRSPKGPKTKGDPALERGSNDLEDVVTRNMVALGYHMEAWSG